MIVHFIAREDLEQLCKIFAKPIENSGRLDWVPPRWWFVMKDTMRLEEAQWRQQSPASRASTAG